MDYLTFKSGLSRRVLGTEYTLRGLVRLFFHFQIFDYTETLVSMPFVSDKASKQAKVILRETSQVFFRAVVDTTEQSRQAMDDFAIRRMQMTAGSTRWMTIDDKRQKR